MRKSNINKRVFFISNVKTNILIKGNTLLNGNVILRAVERGLLSKSSLEAARKAIKKIIKKRGQLLIRANAFMPVTSKPSEVRMGKGKGKITGYVCPLKEGAVIFEIKGCLPKMSVNALERASVKLSVKTKIERLAETFSTRVLVPSSI